MCITPSKLRENCGRGGGKNVRASGRGGVLCSNFFQMKRFPLGGRKNVHEIQEVNKLTSSGKLKLRRFLRPLSRILEVVNNGWREGVSNQSNCLKEPCLQGCRELQVAALWSIITAGVGFPEMLLPLFHPASYKSALMATPLSTPINVPTHQVGLW